MQKFINRFRAKATKAKQAQSRLKIIEKMEKVSAVYADSPFCFEFFKPENCPYPLLKLDETQIAYNSHIVLDKINISIAPQSRIGILGPNGSGKSSLIKCLAGMLLPVSGQREEGYGLKIGYFAQHQIDHLVLSDTPLMHLKRLAKQASEEYLRTFLGSFGFSGDDVFVSVKQFSGGEKSRLALALMVWQKPNLLLLDEPTNHLDLEMRHALVMALQQFEGAVILVSHDRFLIRSTMDQLWLVADKQIKLFDGDLNDYEKWLIAYRQSQITPSGEASHLSRKEIRQQEAKEREKRRPLLQQMLQIEKRLEACQQELAVIENDLADTTFYESTNKTRLQEYLLKQANLKNEIMKLEEDWLTVLEKQDQLSN